MFSDLEQSTAYRIKRNGTQLFVPRLSGAGIATHRLDDLVERRVNRRLVRGSVRVGISHDDGDGIRAAPPDAIEKGALLFDQDLLEGPRCDTLGSCSQRLIRVSLGDGFLLGLGLRLGFGFRIVVADATQASE